MQRYNHVVIVTIVFDSTLSWFSRVQLFATPWTVAHQSLCPWDFLGKSTETGYQTLLWGMFLTQESNLRLLWLLHCKRIVLPLSDRVLHEYALR